MDVKGLGMWGSGGGVGGVRNGLGVGRTVVWDCAVRVRTRGPRVELRERDKNESFWGCGPRRSVGSAAGFAWVGVCSLRMRGPVLRLREGVLLARRRLLLETNMKRMSAAARHTNTPRVTPIMAGVLILVALASLVLDGVADAEGVSVDVDVENAVSVGTAMPGMRPE